MLFGSCAFPVLQIGAAEVSLARADDGRQISLLIGTDPCRAPIRLNRWGFATQTTCEGRTDVFGLMTQSDEEKIDQATTSLRPAPSAPRPSRPYVHAGHLYDLVQISAERRSTATDGDVIEREFRATNRATRETTTFHLTSRATGELAGVPIRAVYRPRWWLELQLTLQNEGA